MERHQFTRRFGSAFTGYGRPSNQTTFLREPYWLADESKETNMLIIDAPLLLAAAALLTSISTLVWSIRRKA